MKTAINYLVEAAGRQKKRICSSNIFKSIGFDNENPRLGWVKVPAWRLIEKSLKEELGNLFTNFTEIEISNFLEPGPDELVHKNNLEAIDWIMCKILTPSSQDLIISVSNTNDLFLNYRGR